MVGLGRWKVRLGLFEVYVCGAVADIDALTKMHVLTSLS